MLTIGESHSGVSEGILKGTCANDKALLSLEITTTSAAIFGRKRLGISSIESNTFPLAATAKTGYPPST
ncbi:MAG: hypothetical protein ACKOBL_10410, partial [Chloroflexota bacterium]